MPVPPGTMIVSRAFTTVNGEIPYWEFKNSYTEQFADDGVSITNCLGCFWKDRLKFARAILGYPYISGTAGTAGAKLRRKLPEPHPDFRIDAPNEGISPAYAWSMQFLDGLGWEGRNTVTSALSFHDSAPSYDPSTGVFSRPPNDQGLALYAVEFRPRIYTVADDDTADADPLLEQSRFTSPTREPGGENLPIGKGLQFHGPPVSPIGDALGVQLFPQSIINYTWHELPADVVPLQALEGYWNGSTLVQGMVGSVNLTTFLKKPPGTLLGLPPTVRRYQGRTADIWEDYTFHFQYRPQGHNRFLRPISGAWDTVERVYDTSKGAVLTYEFANVFDVSQT